jgi:Protein of unknown function (DUF4058)
MPSPFPGMDPYLEDPAFWPDFHSTFINCWREAIADQLPDDYEARIDERVYLVEQDPHTRKLIYPDIALSHGQQVKPRSGSGRAVATLEPVTIPISILEGPREAFVEILHRPKRSLVTVLELLSPANKNQPGRVEYLLKRNALLHQQVHFVELDLLLGGFRVPMDKPLPLGDCYYVISRWEPRPDSQVYGWSLREPLPSLPVPLRASDNDIVIDYATVFATAFQRGRFHRSISYQSSCPAPLTDADRAWAEAVASPQ